YEYTTSKSNTSGYTHSATWTTEDWEIINNCNTKVPSWMIDFKDPSNEYFPNWDGSVAEATKRRTDLDSEWMWQVSNSGRNLSIKVQSRIDYRLTRANGNWHSYDGAIRKVSSRFVVSQPPHISVASKKFSVQRSGHLLQTELTTAGNWTAHSDSDWCQVSPSSGTGTSGDGRVIFINVDPFTQDGAFTTREGHISFKDETTGQTQTIWITQTNRGE
ncbi:MAG: BACON domain-containing protein, partial [Synergistaceae bacterium]|nr:BACON domain-containing protein [Synergistaceae bacterium]